jgi:hypothetical protein
MVGAGVEAEEGQVDIWGAGMGAGAEEGVVGVVGVVWV